MENIGWCLRSNRGVEPQPESIRMLTGTPQVNLHLFQNVRIFYVFPFLSLDESDKNN